MSLSVEKNNVFVVSSQYDTLDKMIEMLSKDGKDVVVAFSDECDGVIHCITRHCKLCGIMPDLTESEKKNLIENLSDQYDYVILHISIMYNNKELR